MLTHTRALILCTATSATALVGIFHVESQALRERPAVRATAVARDSTPRSPASTPHAGHDLARPATSPAPSPTVATPARADTAAAQGDGTSPPSATAPSATAQEQVTVPSLLGLRLTYAANRAERRGLRLEVRDENGDPVDLAYSRFYRVVGQSTRRGAVVARGFVLELRVRDRTASYSDWG